MLALVLDWLQPIKNQCGNSSRFLHEWPGCWTGAISDRLMVFASSDMTSACSTSWHLSMHPWQILYPVDFQCPSWNLAVKVILVSSAINPLISCLSLGVSAYSKAVLNTLWSRSLTFSLTSLSSFTAWVSNGLNQIFYIGSRILIRYLLPQIYTCIR